MLVENVQDYPRPPALESISKRLRVIQGGLVIAETYSGLRVLESFHPPTYYFPPADVKAGVLEQCPGGAVCEWKGRSICFDVALQTLRSSQAAWTFPDPTPAFSALAGYIAFFPQRVELCMVGDDVAEPQPGSYYGGWVTPQISGLVKGAPGSEFW